MAFANWGGVWGLGYEVWGMRFGVWGWLTVDSWRLILNGTCRMSNAEWTMNRHLLQTIRPFIFLVS